MLLTAEPISECVRRLEHEVSVAEAVHDHGRLIDGQEPHRLFAQVEHAIASIERRGECAPTMPLEYVMLSITVLPDLGGAFPVEDQDDLLVKMALLLGLATRR